MTSRKQIEANRRNARKSTGPRTPGGRAASSKNALRHGLTSKDIVGYGESAKEFMEFYREQYEALNPTDAIAEAFVERIVICQWRLRRLYRAEATLMDWGGDAATAFLDYVAILTALSRYETSLDRALQRARHDLERHQARCRGEDVAAPIAITVSGSLDADDQPCPSRARPREPVEGRSPPSLMPETGDSCRAESDLVDGALVPDRPQSD
jgi:hypothetical protein